MRDTRRRSSPSSRPARTRRRRTTTPPSGSSRPASPIVLDIGGTLGGYGSDITRTLWVSGPDDMARPAARFAELFAVLHEAQALATAAVRPGVAMPGDRRGSPDRRSTAGHGDGVLPSDRARHRPRRARGPVSRRRPWSYAARAGPSTRARTSRVPRAPPGCAAGAWPASCRTRRRERARRCRPRRAHTDPRSRPRSGCRWPFGSPPRQRRAPGAGR